MSRLTICNHPAFQPEISGTYQAYHSSHQWPTRIVLFCAVLCYLLLPQSAYAANKTTVIYPELIGPYKNVFETILQGVESNTNQEIVHLPLSREYQLDDLKQQLNDNQDGGIITLGKRAYLAAKQLTPERPVVAGALSIVPNGISGISLSADPEILFSRLKFIVSK